MNHPFLPIKVLSESFTRGCPKIATRIFLVSFYFLATILIMTLMQNLRRSPDFRINFYLQTNSGTRVRAIAFNQTMEARASSDKKLLKNTKVAFSILNGSNSKLSA
jgi:hypothetical protein